MSSEPSVALSRDDEFRVAASASCDLRTLRRVLRGERVRGQVRLRIEAALRDLHTVQKAHGAP